MKKFVCTVCGYVYEGEQAPAECPVCHAASDKFKEVTGEMTLAAEHEYGVYAKIHEHCLCGDAVHCAYLTNGGPQAQRRSQGRSQGPEPGSNRGRGYRGRTLGGRIVVGTPRRSTRYNE